MVGQESGKNKLLMSVSVVFAKKKPGRIQYSVYVLSDAEMEIDTGTEC